MNYKTGTPGKSERSELPQPSATECPAEASDETGLVRYAEGRWRPAILPEDAVQAELLEVLGGLRGRRVAVLFNLGNRGDGLIHRGARRLLATLKLNWQEIREMEAPASIAADVLLVFGSGAFCRTKHTLVPLVQRYADQVGEVVILPGTFDVTSAPVRAFARSWDRRFIVFCRERRSYEDLLRMRTAARRVALAHDLAFWADVSGWAARPHEGAVGIFRGDREAVFDARPRNLPGVDVSRGSDTEPEALLDYVARHAVIHTDRTHAAVAGAMMGREVYLYRNAYFKNAAIFAHSLAHLPKVHFVGTQPFSWRECARVLFAWHVRRNAWHARRKLREFLGTSAA